MCANCRDLEQHASDLRGDLKYLEAVVRSDPRLYAQLLAGATESRFVPYVPADAPLDNQLVN